MKLLTKVFKYLKFDEPDDRFELREAESGAPGSIFGWNEKKTAGNTLNPKIPSKIEKQEKLIKAAFDSDENPDIVLRRFSTGDGTQALLVYINGMAKSQVISDFIIRPMMRSANENGADADFFLSEVLEVASAEKQNNFNDVIHGVLDGKTAVFLDGSHFALLLETPGYEKRSVPQTENERIVRGPKESFNESLQTNVSLIRRIIRTRDLIVKYEKAGGENNTRLALIYRKDEANAALVDEVMNKLRSMKNKLLVSTGVIEQFIEDDSLFPLPQTLSTERPDRVASFVMQGAVAVLSDGSPFAIVLPITLNALLSSPEDTYLRRPLGTVLRVIRYTGALLSIILPGYFIALTMYHQGLLSTEVLSTVIKSREMVFEPLPFEMLLLLFVFQLIREAGMRVPGSVGQAIGVIGGLILGQAAVAANLASTVILIIVALSGLGNLCIPDYSTQVACSYFRIAFVLAAWLAGLLGLTSALIVFVAYIANMKSFGVPFLAPYAPKTYSKRPLILRGKIGKHLRADDYINSEDDSMIY